MFPQASSGTGQSPSHSFGGKGTVEGKTSPQDKSARIAILTPYGPNVTGGTEVFNDQLASRFPGMRIFAYRSTPEEGSGWGLDYVGLRHARHAWTVAREFMREHRLRPFDLAICNGVYGWPLTVWPQGVPAIQVYHYTMAGLAQTGIAERGVRFLTGHVESVFDGLSGKGKHVVAVSRRVHDEAKAFYRLDGRVIPNGVDLHVFRRLEKSRCRTELGLPADAQIGLFVGRPDYVKGFDVVSKVARSLGRVLFVVVGECPAVAANMIVRSRVSHSMMPTYYSAADFLIAPSRYEGFGLTIIEALACDLPIVVSHQAYTLEEDWRHFGLTVDGHDANSYVEAITRILDSRTEWTSHERIATRYSLERFTENWQSQISAVVQ